ncbi:MAG: hypothetical protein WHX52_13680 [Anaerolineae bacterium]
MALTDLTQALDTSIKKNAFSGVGVSIAHNAAQANSLRPSKLKFALHFLSFVKIGANS